MRTLTANEYGLVSGGYFNWYEPGVSTDDTEHLYPGEGNYSAFPSGSQVVVDLAPVNVCTAEGIAGGLAGGAIGKVVGGVGGKIAGGLIGSLGDFGGPEIGFPTTALGAVGGRKAGSWVGGVIGAYLGSGVKTIECKNQRL